MLSKCMAPNMLTIIMAMTTTGNPAAITTALREDLSDIIYDVSPTDTPFLSAIPKGKATNTLHEWQTDTLRSSIGELFGSINQGVDISVRAETSLSGGGGGAAHHAEHVRR